MICFVVAVVVAHSGYLRKKNSNPTVENRVNANPTMGMWPSVHVENRDFPPWVQIFNSTTSTVGKPNFPRWYYVITPMQNLVENQRRRRMITPWMFPFSRGRNNCTVGMWPFYHRGFTWIPMGILKNPPHFRPTYHWFFVLPII